MTCPTMKSIRDLDGYKFVIPVYQRGFRWTRQQIKELMDDLYEFQKEDKSTYCLQNVTIRKREDNKYEVIDGQQRLTAIWILIMAYMGSKKYDDEPMPVYSLTYEEKDDLTKYLEEITKTVTEDLPEDETRKPIISIEHKKDIDSAFIYDAFQYILKDYEKNNNKYSAVLNAIFNDKFQSGDKQISIIWNEITPVGEDETAQEKYVIGRFSNLNANKIPLTESELIKAYFIDEIADEKAQEFSLQWEEMERGFNNDEFWWFLSSGKDEETRMDILFRIFLNLDQRGEQHSLSRKIREEIDENGAENIWKEIVQIYDTLRDWYSDYYYYHVIGLIIAIKEVSASSIIKELYVEYRKSSKGKFKEYLKKEIRRQKIFKIPFLSDEKDDWDVEVANQILLEGCDNNEISYIKNKNCIKPILLLFNISLLLNAYNVNPENAAERFSFKLYKSKDNPIEIEHINPKHLEGKNAEGADYKPDEKRKWADDTIEIVVDEKLRDELKEESSKANWSNKNNSLIRKIEDAAQVNSLSNLTLLDKNLNIRYGDNFFMEKKKHILAARFGYSIPGVKSGTNFGDHYKQSVIFPGTMLVFMRQYKTNKDTDLDDSESKNMNNDRWNAKDRANYIVCMQESIFRFLSPIKPTVNESDGE